MKNYFLSLSCILIYSLINFSCSKEIEHSSTVVLPDLIGDAIGLTYGNSEESENASILIKSTESMNSPTGLVFLTSGAQFKDENGTKIRVGDLQIFEIDIPFINSEARYLNRDLGFLLHERGTYNPGDDALIKLIAGDEKGKYASFEKITSTSKAFNANVNLQSDSRRIDKNAALRINFENDPNFKDTYFILTQIDKPSLILVTQGNEFLIKESQLSFLDVGQAATYYLVRGELDCMMNNKTKVCIKKVLVATGGGLKVVDTSNK